MDIPSSATLPKPRLRLLRRSPSPNPASETTPQPGTRSLFSAVHDEDDELPTPRVQPKPIASPNGDPTPKSFPSLTGATSAPTETPAARLRALLARESRSPRSTTPVIPPAPPSEADSVAESSRLGSSTSNVTRTSLKDIFSRALREPGDTPQKGRLRRNSIDGSSMEITPVVDRNRGPHRTARRSLSDEEAENPKSYRRSDPSFRLSTAVTFDNLRARLISSQSQLLDQNLQVALASAPESSLASASTSNPQHHRQPSTSSAQLHPASQQVTTTTPYPSFQLSAQLASQSNLLEQDSDMQRAMGDVLNSENEGSTLAPNIAKSTMLPFDSRPPSFPDHQKNGSRPEPRRTSHEFDSSTTSPSVNGRTNMPHLSQEEQRSPQREREWNRPRLPSGSNTPEPYRRYSQELRLRRTSQDFRSHINSPSHEPAIAHSSAADSVHRPLERRGSFASLRSFDDDHSSRPSSLGSQADYRDRIHELKQERNHEREREWNKRQPPSRPSSSLSASSNRSFSHSHSHPPRSPSAIPYLTPTHASLQRKSSRTSLRSDSPSSLASSQESLKERDLGEKKEISHERERNWNSPRPRWSTSKSPSTSYLKTRNKDGTPLRPASSLTQDASLGSAKLQSTSPKASTSSAALPASLHKMVDPLDLDANKGATGAIHHPLTDGFSNEKTPGTTSKFGWNFARNSLPPLELDDPVDQHKNNSPSRPTSGPPEVITPSHIPVRSRMKGFSNIGHATSDMSLTHIVGDESSFQYNSQDGLSQVVEPRGRGEFPMTTTSLSQEGVVLASDEEPVIDLPRSTTPKSDPPDFISEEIDTDTETEVLTSPSPQGSPQLAQLGAQASILNEAPLHETNDPPRSQTPIIPLDDPSISVTPPGTPPSISTGSGLTVPETTPSFSLVTPPRQAFGSSTIDFQTPSPPHDLPDLPGPPTSDDDTMGSSPIKDRRFDVNSNLTLTKTPKPPGAWTATPLAIKLGRRSPSPTVPFPSESTPPAFTSTPLPRSSTHPHARAETENTGDDGLLTPVGTLSRAKSLPLRTPAPPGAWMATPGQSAVISNGADQSQFGSLSRRKGPLKVRFDVAESEASATEGHPGSPLSAIKLTNPDLPISKLTADRGTDDNAEVTANQGSQSTMPPEWLTTPISQGLGSSPRSLRKSPAVRLVDSYGRARVSEEGNVASGHADVEKTTSPSTPRRSLVRIVDAMGREVDDALEIPHAPAGGANKTFDADVSTVSDDSPGHAEALAHMRKTLKDLTENLSDADRSEDLELNSSHLKQLEEVSQAARLARNQLAQNLQIETAKHDNLQRKSKLSSWTRGILPVATRKPWNTAIIYCGVIVQLLLVLAMWRYAHAEARCLFYTTYYDPLYPEFTPIQGGSCFSGTVSTTRSWSLPHSYETIQREGWWSIGKEILHVVRHTGDRAWERWGEHARSERPT